MSLKTYFVIYFPLLYKCHVKETNKHPSYTKQKKMGEQNKQKNKSTKTVHFFSFPLSMHAHIIDKQQNKIMHKCTTALFKEHNKHTNIQNKNKKEIGKSNCAFSYISRFPTY